MAASLRPGPRRCGEAALRWGRGGGGGVLWMRRTEEEHRQRAAGGEADGGGGGAGCGWAGCGERRVRVWMGVYAACFLEKSLILLCLQRYP